MYKPWKVILIGIFFLLLLDGCGYIFYRATISGVVGKDVRNVKVNLKDKKIIEQGRNRVYYPEGAEELANEALQILVKQEQMITDYLGIGSEKTGVVLIQRVPEEVRYIVDSAPRRWAIWPVAVDNLQVLSHASEFDDLYWTIIHERTEGAIGDALVKKGSLYSFNRETRWIGDGIAELLGFRFSEEYSPIAAAYMLNSRWETIRKVSQRWNFSRYNLKEFKGVSGSIKENKRQMSMMNRYPQIVGANYGMSLYYWAALEREKGPQTVKEIVLKLQGIKEPTNRNIEGVISDIAGQTWVDRIEKLDVNEALEFFKGEMELLIPMLNKGLRSQERHIRMASYEVLRNLDEEVFDIDPSGIPTTAIIVDIYPGTSAYKAGLRRGDIIESINGELIQSFDKFLKEIKNLNQVEVKVLRGGKTKSFEIESFAGCRLRGIAR